MGGIKYRRIQAGLNILKGMPAKKAMTAAGYSPATARNPAAKGADGCVRDALEAHPEVAPRQLVEKVRRLLDKRVDYLLENPQQLNKQRLGEVARVFEAVEKAHGGRPVDDAESARDWGTRAAWIEQAFRAYQVAKSSAGPQDVVECSVLSPADNPAPSKNADIATIEAGSGVR